MVREKLGEMKARMFFGSGPSVGYTPEYDKEKLRLIKALEVLLEYVSNSKCKSWIKFGNSESGYSQEHDDKECKKCQALTRVEEVLK